MKSTFSDIGHWTSKCVVGLLKMKEINGKLHEHYLLKKLAGFLTKLV